MNLQRRLERSSQVGGNKMRSMQYHESQNENMFSVGRND